MLNIALAQLNPLVGDLEANVDAMRQSAQTARAQGADVIVFPELSLTGYPPEDLLLMPLFVQTAEHLLQTLAQETDDQLLWVIGALGQDEQGRLTNSAVAMAQGKILCRYAKQSLPNYGVFDEQRYFSAGNQAGIVQWKGINLGLLVCEDLWQAEPAQQAKQAGAEMLISLHASPYEVAKTAQRIAVAQARVQETGLPLVYVNQVGGQDGLVFDGGSFVMSADTQVHNLPQGRELMGMVSWRASQWQCISGEWLTEHKAYLSEWAEVWQMLVLGLGDYVRKNGFKRVLLGLSGGIDSALVLALAVDALGADAVEAVMMPFSYTSDMSKADAQQQAELLGVRYTSLPIEPTYLSVEATLAERFSGLSADVTEENLQARIRGLLLMAISNKTGALLLTTSNKSESAMGYATLYGDMNGGFAPLKDVPKTWVYALAAWRNQQSQAIPQRVIDRPPSAELRPDQTDQDSLPPYDQLDAWLHQRMNDIALTGNTETLTETIQDEALGLKAIRLLRLSEYKRRQAAIGIKITSRSFDKDWRMPITNGWKL